VDWQLAWYDVPGSVVASAGASLDELLGFVPEGLDDLSRFRRPRTGWRLIDGDSAVPERGGLSVLAAPWPAAGRSSWALLDIANPHGRARVITSSPTTLRPGRAHRRRGLRLEWPIEHIMVSRGDPVAPTVLVINTTSDVWAGDGEDHDMVSGRVVGRDGSSPPPHALMMFRGFVALPVKRLGPIPPGGTVELCLSQLDDTDLTALPPGEWLLEARLKSLELAAPPIGVTVTA
jgi:hypothetical protein